MPDDLGDPSTSGAAVAGVETDQPSFLHHYKRLYICLEDRERKEEYPAVLIFLKVSRY